MKIAYGLLGTVTLGAAIVLGGCDRGNREAASPAPGVPGLPAEAERQVERAGSAVDDASVTAKVKAALIAEPGLSGLAINVDTDQNVVTLTGSVGSDDLRAQAEKTARRVEGVTDVRNNLELKQPG